MGKVGTPGIALNPKAYRMTGFTEAGRKTTVRYVATAPQDGFVIASVSNRAETLGRPDDYGECMSTIMINNDTVADSAGNQPQISGQVRKFGSSATAALSVTKGDTIELSSYSSATKAFYYMSVLSTAGDLTFSKS